MATGFLAALCETRSPNVEEAGFELFILSVHILVHGHARPPGYSGKCTLIHGGEGQVKWQSWDLWVSLRQSLCA